MLKNCVVFKSALKEDVISRVIASCKVFDRELSPLHSLLVDQYNGRLASKDDRGICLSFFSPRSTYKKLGLASQKGTGIYQRFVSSLSNYNKSK